MKKDKIFALVTIFISIVAAIFINLLAKTYEVNNKLELYILPAAGLLFGFLILFTDFESRVELDEVIEEFPQSIEDNIEDVRSGNLFTLPNIAIIITTVAFLLEVFFISHFRKWNAQWWGVSVLLVSCLTIIGAIIFFLKTGWFANRHDYDVIDARKFAIPAIGFAICLLLGVFFAEPVRYGQRSAKEQMLLSKSDYSNETRGVQIVNIIFRSGGSSSSSIGIDDCEECGLVIIVVVLVVASAIIPHFWLLATSILLTWMTMVALRYLLHNPRLRSTYYYRR